MLYPLSYWGWPLTPSGADGVRLAHRCVLVKTGRLTDPGGGPTCGIRDTTPELTSMAAKRT